MPYLIGCSVLSVAYWYFVLINLFVCAVVYSMLVLRCVLICLLCALCCAIKMLKFILLFACYIDADNLALWHTYNKQTNNMETTLTTMRTFALSNNINLLDLLSIFTIFPSGFIKTSFPLEYLTSEQRELRAKFVAYLKSKI